MAIRPASIRASLGALLILVATPNAGFAYWLANGNPICSAPGEQTSISVLGDVSGGAYVVWRDSRRGVATNDVYAARVLADGTLAPGWPVNGRVVSASGTAVLPRPVATASGALLVFWIDSATLSVRMQSMTSGGVLSPGFPADGLALPIGVGGPAGLNLAAASDGAGGAYLMWSAFDGSSDALRVLRVDGLGAAAPSWPIAGRLVGGSALSFGRPWLHLGLTRDPSGGVLVSQIYEFEDFPSGSSRIGNVQRLDANGAITMNHGLIPDGRAGGPGDHSVVVSMAAIPDGAGGAFASWRIGGPLGPAAFAQRYLSAGSEAWPTTSAPVTGALLDDGAGGIYLFGSPPAADELALHRRDASAAAPPGWSSGVTVSTSGSYPAWGAVRSGSRVYACWSSGASLSADVFAAGVEADGSFAPGYSVEGRAVAEIYGLQLLTGLAAGTAGDAYVAWLDTRNGEADVYMARLGAGGPIVEPPVSVPGDAGRIALGIARSTPNPQRSGTLRVDLAIAGETPVRLEVLDLAGRAWHREVLAGRAAGVHSVHVRPDVPLPPGLYFVRVAQGGAQARARVAIVR